MLTSQGFVDTIPDETISDQPPLIPHSIEAEEALLGALIIDPAQMLEVSYLIPRDFYLTKHGYIYHAMATLFKKHGVYDHVTVCEVLDSDGHLEDVGGQGSITGLMADTPTSYGAPEYAAIVYRHSVSRQVIERCARLTQAAYKNVAGRSGDELVSDGIHRLAQIDTTRNVTNGPQSVAKGINTMIDRMEEIEQTGQVSGLQTGIRRLDGVLGGFQDKKFYLLAGRPGMGKSALAIQIAHNIAQRGTGVLIFALEMTEADIAARLTSLVCGVPYESFNRGSIGDDWQRVLDAGSSVSDLPIFIDDTPALTIANIRFISQKEMLTKSVGLVIVDHVGIARAERTNGNPYQAASEKADSVMALPKQIDCPVLAISQLSRKVEERSDKRPQMHDLRDSGKWEENADGILFLYRDEVYNSDTAAPCTGEIHIAKNRGGKRGTASIYAQVATNRFCDIERTAIC